MKKRIIVFSNTSWNLYNFRLPIINEARRLGYEVICVCTGDNYSDKLGLHCDKLILSSLNPTSTFILSDLKYFILCFTILIKYPPHCVLSFTIKNNIYVGLLCRFLKIPFIPTISGLGSGLINKSKNLKKSILCLYRSSLKNANCIYFHNKTDLRFFTSNKIAKHDVCKVVGGSGVNIHEYAPIFNRRKTNSKLVHFYFIGRLLKDKGVVEFLDAAYSLAKTNKSLRFHLVGKIDIANPSAISNSLIKRYTQLNSIIYHGETDNVKDYLEKADFVVLPSYREGLSKILLEAASMGIPMIATDVPGCREIVIEDKTGITCKPKNYLDLARAIFKASTLPNDTKKALGNNARLIIEEKFSSNIVSASYIDTIKSIDPYKAVKKLRKN